MEDDPHIARDRERQVLERSIELLEIAKQQDRYGKDGIEAIFYTRRVWTRFIDDLRQPENELPVELKANIISIAMWILKECEQIRKRNSTNYQDIIDDTTILKEGLS